MPRVAVVIPTFGQAPFVRRALESLVGQSFGDWEALVVDDASPDGTAEIVAGYAARDCRIVLERLPANVGLGGALNRGLDGTSAALVAYLPTDDVWYPDHLASLVRLLDERPDASLAYAGLRHHYNREALEPLDGDGLQLVQVVHRRTEDRWLERSDLVTDDLGRMLFDRLRCAGAFVGSGTVTCEWVDHPGQLHKVLREPVGGINRYRQRFAVAHPLRFHTTTGDRIDEWERYARFRDRPAATPAPAGADGLRILLVGELAYNADRVVALEERGHRLFGLWMPDPYWYNTVGPLPFGHVVDATTHDVRAAIAETKPDVIYALLNWQAVPWAAHVLRENPGVPFVWHYKEGPFISLEKGHWADLVELTERADGVIHSSAEMRDWFATVVPTAGDRGRTLVLDGDLPKADWFDAPFSRRLSGRHGELHTVVPGRPIGLHPETVAELAAQDVHLHFYGDFTHGQWRAWTDRASRLAPGHLHLHSTVDQLGWVRELSRYDAGWLHVFRSRNGGDIRRADWDDLNVPARMATLAAAAVPMLQRSNPDAVVAAQSLARGLGVSIFFDEIGEVGERLRDRQAMAAARAAVVRTRGQFTFDAHADRLVAFFRTVIASVAARAPPIIATMATITAPPTFARPDADAPWRPSPELLRDSRLAAFLRTTGADGLELLQARALADPAWFWGAAVADLELAWQRPFERVLDLERGIAFPRWWSGGAFNHAVAATEPWARRQPDAEAIAWEGEDGDVRRLTFAELDAEVRRASAMLAANGVGAGTRVGIFLPMLPETAIAVLALGRLGAVFTPIFSGYAAPAVATRLRAFAATHLITADGFRRRGSLVPLKATADEAVASAPSVGRVIVVSRLAGAASPEAGKQVPWDPLRDRWWEEGLPARSGSEPDGPPVAPTDPEAPYMVIYTSGTTGVPKGTVHVHGGFPIKAAEDLAHTFDLRAGDALFWFTDLGWMMGPWAISGALLLGARIVLYEGAPDFPDPGRLWAVAAAHRATHVGVSPTLVRALLVHGDEPVRAHDLSALRVLGSTGEPWNPDPWHWYFRTAGGGRLPIVNYSGGTEVSGGILGCSVLRPIRPTSFNGPCPGMAADVVDADGRTLVDAVGELAVRAPWPGMTRSFWPGGPAGDERYLETYWSRQPGVWIHGDWAVRDRDGFWYLHGRSDDTLKVAGKRVGPAEVEAAAVAHPAVVEAAAIGVPDELKGEAIVVLCVVRRDAGVASEELAGEVSALVVRDLGKPTRPSAVAIVPELPRTRSGKVMRRVARGAWLGRDPGDLSALENPSAVEAIAAVAARTRGETTR